MAPLGASFVVVSFTEGNDPPSVSRSTKDKSNIDRYALDLWGIAATGDTFKGR